MFNETTTCQKGLTYLIVSVGEGTGEFGVDLASGILIFSEGLAAFFGGLGTRRGTFSSNKEVNQIFTFVDGNRSTHLNDEETAEINTNK